MRCGADRIFSELVMHQPPERVPNRSNGTSIHLIWLKGVHGFPPLATLADPGK